MGIEEFFWDISEFLHIDDEHKGEYLRVFTKLSQQLAFERLGRKLHTELTEEDEDILFDVVHFVLGKNISELKKIIQHTNEMNKISKFQPHFSEDDFIGYRDKDGYLVLPKEWRD